MQRALAHDELPLGVVAGHEVGVDVVAALLVVCGLKLDPAVVVGEDVGEPILGPVDRKVGGGATTIDAFITPFLSSFLFLF